MHVCVCVFFVYKAGLQEHCETVSQQFWDHARAHGFFFFFLLPMTWPSQQFADAFLSLLGKNTVFRWKSPLLLSPPLICSPDHSVCLLCFCPRPLHLCLLKACRYCISGLYMWTAVSQTTCCHILTPPPPPPSLRGAPEVMSGQRSWQSLYVFLESRFPLFSDFITPTLRSLSYTISHCCDVAISSMEAHLSWVHSTADIMGSLCVYLLILAPKGLWLLKKKTLIRPWLDFLILSHVFLPDIDFLIRSKLHHVT